MKTYCILASAGSGSRMNAGFNKIFLRLNGRSVLQHSISLFDHLIDEMILVYRREDLSEIRNHLSEVKVSFPVRLTEGGSTRMRSVLNGLEQLSFQPKDIVLVHDAARCLTEPALIKELISNCRMHGSSVPGIPVTSTVKICNPDHQVSRTPDRSSLFEIQTPQAFNGIALLEASRKAAAADFEATDDASVMEHAGLPVYVVSGSRTNIKITTREDLMFAEMLLHTVPAPYRIGTGYDVHRLVDNRKLILCGVDIPYEKGLLGHSDADVAVHALMDAMLGAASLGDIGQHFPDTDPRWKDISSLLLLKETNRLIHATGYSLLNADMTIVAQRPKLSPFLTEMKKNLADTLVCEPCQLSVKATTTEQLGFEGRGEGISTQAVCMLVRESSY